MPEPHQNPHEPEENSGRRGHNPNSGHDPFDALKPPRLASERDEMAMRFRKHIKSEEGTVHDSNGREVFLHNAGLVNLIREDIFGISDDKSNRLKLNFEVTGVNKSGGYSVLVSILDPKTNEYLLAEGDSEVPPFSWDKSRRLPANLFAGYILDITPQLGHGVSTRFSRVYSPAVFEAEIDKLTRGDNCSLIADYLKDLFKNVSGSRLDLSQSKVQAAKIDNPDFRSLLVSEPGGVFHSITLGMMADCPMLGVSSVATFVDGEFTPKKISREESLSSQYSQYPGNSSFAPVSLDADSFESQLLNFAVKSGVAAMFKANWNPSWSVNIQSLLKVAGGPNIYRALITVNDQKFDSILPGARVGEVVRDSGILGLSTTVLIANREIPKPTLWKGIGQSIGKLFGRVYPTSKISSQFHLDGLVASPRWIGEQMADLSKNIPSSFLFSPMAEAILLDLRARGCSEEGLTVSKIRIVSEDSGNHTGFCHFKLLCSHQRGEHLLRFDQHEASGIITNGIGGFESVAFFEKTLGKN